MRRIPSSLEWLGFANAMAGQIGEAQKVLAELQAFSQNQPKFTIWLKFDVQVWALIARFCRIRTVLIYFPWARGCYFPFLHRHLIPIIRVTFHQAILNSMSTTSNQGAAWLKTTMRFRTTSSIMAEVGSFDGEIEIFLGKEYERHIITQATVLYIPRGFEHNPMDIKKLNKPMMLSALHLAPYFNGVYQVGGCMEF